MRAGELRAGDPDAFSAAYMALLDRLPVRVLTGFAAPDEEAIAAEAEAVTRMMLAVYAPTGTVPASVTDADRRNVENMCP